MAAEAAGTCFLTVLEAGLPGPAVGRLAGFLGGGGGLSPWHPHVAVPLSVSVS